MPQDQNIDIEELYARGLAQFQAADWAGAIQTLTTVRSLTNTYTEIDALIADAQFKLGLEHAETPEAAPPPKYKWFLRPRFITAVPVLLVFGALLSLLRPVQPQRSEAIVAAPTSAIRLPTPAPTNTPLPTSTPLPTNTPLPTSTPLPEPTATPVPGPGELKVQMAAGQPSTRNQSIEIILDASGSMNALVGDRRRIEIAHDALTKMVTTLPGTANIALRTYGHRRGSDCNDIELVAPLGPLDPPALSERINAIKPAPLGQTPIGTSLQLAAQDLKDVPGDLRLLLVSDGEESCQADPVQIASAIRAANPRLTIDVIGFTVDTTISERLRAVAQAGGGQYFDAADAQQLGDALLQSMLYSYRVLGADGQEVYRGVLGSGTTLPPGQYTVEVIGAEAAKLEGVMVDNTHSAVVEVSQQDGTLKSALLPQTAP